MRVDVFSLLAESIERGGRVLEHGCGSGRALLELQYLFPTPSTFFCTNLRGYDFPQADGSVSSLTERAAVFEIPVRCRQRWFNGHLEYLLPTVSMVNPLDGHGLPFPDDYFRVVFSQHSLNEGKILPERSHVPIMHFSRIITPDTGMAWLHLLTIRNKDQCLSAKRELLFSHDIILPDRNLRLSVVGYFADVYWGQQALVVVMRKCFVTKDDKPGTSCVLESAPSELLFRACNFNLTAPANVQSPIMRSSWTYSSTYITNLISRLRCWEKKRAIGDNVVC